MPDDLVAVYPGYIILGKPLAIPLYSPSGVLLAEKGSILDQEQYVRVHRHKQIMTPRATLIEVLENLKIKGHDEIDSSDAYKLPSTIHRIVKLETEFLESLLLDQTDFEEAILSIVVRLDSVVKSNANASLAKIFLRTAAYPIIEAGFSTAIIGSILTSNLNWREKERLTFLCAAITLDLGILLAGGQSNALNISPQPAEILEFEHPDHSARLLLDRNIKNKKWLKYVHTHHQNESNASPLHPISPSTAMAMAFMHLTNRYVHLILGYGQQQIMFPDVALKAIIDDDSSRYTALFRKLVLEKIGLYPPGSMVKLASGEIAIVQRIGTKEDMPFVTIIADAHGITPPQFPVIQTDRRRRLIKAMHFDPKLFKNNDFSKFWR